MEKITDSSQLVVGQKYIRAVVNCLGHYWVEVHKVIGPVFLEDLSHLNMGFCKKIKTYVNDDKDPRDFFVDDLIGHGEQLLIPFSEKILESLGACPEVFSFIELRDDIKLSEEDRKNYLIDWEHRKFEMEETNKYYYSMYD